MGASSNAAILSEDNDAVAEAARRCLVQESRRNWRLRLGWRGREGKEGGVERKKAECFRHGARSRETKDAGKPVRRDRTA